MKVARHEVPENGAKRDIRPARDDRLAASAREAVCGRPGANFRSSLPGRSALKTLTRHFVSGYFH
jgi:hypothetical protein